MLGWLKFLFGGMKNMTKCEFLGLSDDCMTCPQWLMDKCQFENVRNRWS